MTIIKKLKLFKKYMLDAKAADGPVHQADFAMHLEPFDIDAYMRSLHSVSFAREVIDTVRYKGSSYDIVQLERPAPKGAEGIKNMLIIGGVHGNEFAAALAILRIIQDVEANPAVYDRWNIRIIAPINPVGLVYGSRYNEDGYDMNRDFKDFHTVGARVQRDAILAFKPHIIITLHESPSDGFFMFYDGVLPASVREKIIGDLQRAGVALSSKNYFGIAHHAGMWEKPAWTYAVQRLLGIHTLGSYAHRLDIPAITTESCWKDTDVEMRQLPQVVVVRSVAVNFELGVTSFFADALPAI